MARRDLDQWLWQVGAELQRLSEEITPAGPKVARCRSWAPPVDVVELPEALLLRFELAGVRGEDVQVTYHPERHALLVRGRRYEEDLPLDVRGAFHQLEIFFGDFEREVRLPDGEFDLDRIHAVCRTGFLIIRVPRGVQSERAAPQKQRIKVDKQ